MTEFNRTESAKWAQEAQKVVGDLQVVADKALDEAASRGFPAAPGVTLATIMAAGQEAKGKLTEGNGKLYDERRSVLFQQEEFFMKTVVQVAKLAMELYRAELLNALEIEQAQNIALRDKGQADVVRMNAEVDVRQVAIIRGRAEAERQVIGYKVLLALAEKETLVAEIALANAQLATATKKLEIIDSIYQVLAAEELVLVAERARITAEEQVLVAKQALAAVKMGMIPLYAEKASAKEALAAAITAEVPVKIAIKQLGFARIGLKSYEAEVEHEIRQAELVLDLARQELARANKATEIARARSQTAIAGFANTAQISINASRSQAGMTAIDSRMADRIGHATIEVNNGVAIAGHETSILTSELVNILLNLTSRASDEASKVAASASQTSKHFATNLLSRKIVEGAF